MNISQKCNCCLKESVCKYKGEYEHDCERIKRTDGRTTEVSIKCKEFVAKSQGVIREIKEN